MKRLSRRLQGGAAALAALFVASCGSGSFVPVSGRVTLNNAPLANAHVSFQPIGTEGADPGPGSFAKTDAEGRYTLRVVQPDRPGAVVGKHRVRISLLGGETSKVEQDGADLGKSKVTLPQDKVPKRYNTDSTLTFDVPSGGSQAADFALTAP